MSLLLQALKKAEAEKRRRAGLAIAEAESASLADHATENHAISANPTAESPSSDLGLMLVDPDAERSAVGEAQPAIASDEVSAYPELNLLDEEPPQVSSPLPDLAMDAIVAPIAESIPDSPPDSIAMAQPNSQIEANPIEFAMPDAAESWVEPPPAVPLSRQPNASVETPAEVLIAPATLIQPEVVAPIQADEPPILPANPEKPAPEAATIASAQRQARDIFAAPKAPAGRGLLPWLVFGGAVLLAGMVAWFWWQYQQLIQPAAQMKPAAVAPATSASAVVAAEPVLAASASAVSSEYVDAGHASNASEEYTRDESPAPSLAQRPDTPAAAVSPTPIAAQYERNPAAQFIRQPAHDGVNATLLAAWQAYQQGDLSTAERSYRQVLASDPRQRDALLGMAAIAQQNGLPREAESIYRRLLTLNPQDQAANAALLALKSEQLSNKEATLLGQGEASDPAVLGQFFASQQRWSEAQEQFFAAFTANPSVADHAFNLAVSLDHLAQPRLALTYYQRALQATRGATFNRDQVQQRVNELNAAQAGQLEQAAKP